MASETKAATGPASDRRDVPDSPAQLDRGAWWAALKRTAKEFQADNLTDWAAALTYYGILAIFPALLAVVSILGLVGSNATGALIDNLNEVAPGAARDIFTEAIRNLEQSRGAAGFLFVLGLAGAFWSASGYIGAFMRASNEIWDVEEGRPIWKTLPLRLGATVVLLLVMALSAIAVTISGGLAQQVGTLMGIGGTAVDIWNIAKWPVLLAMVSLMFAFLYYLAPNVEHPRFRWVSPGGILAVCLWVIASLGFAFYVSNFGAYNETYGALGGVIVFLVWLWISNIAVLMGAELNAELERGRQIEGGQPSDREPFLPPRDAKASP